MVYDVQWSPCLNFPSFGIIGIYYTSLGLLIYDGKIKVRGTKIMLSNGIIESSFGCLDISLNQEYWTGPTRHNGSCY